MSLQALAAATQEMHTSFAKLALQDASLKCFRMCYHSGSTSSSTSASASPIGSSISSTQQQCVTNCLERFLEARQIVAKHVAKNQ